MHNDTMVTLVGLVATEPVYGGSAYGGAARFRLAVTPRRWDREKETWFDGHTSYYTVWAPKALGVNVAASVSVGEPVLVRGRLKVKEDNYDGRRGSSVEIDAVAVGHDLARGTSDFRRVTPGRPGAGESGAFGWPEGGGTPPEPGARAAVLPGPVPEPVPVPPF
ncbi:single-stranded DNA-binding protein [Streptomyces sp. NPDC060194]|uniref:single-stranded DNA-binding protein n=1 Tax=Streptomyces sp. NPDC060194 TaxID=3347069 RepID=UPI003653E279